MTADEFIAIGAEFGGREKQMVYWRDASRADRRALALEMINRGREVTITRAEDDAKVMACPSTSPAKRELVQNFANERRAAGDPFHDPDR